MAALATKNVACTDLVEARWGSITSFVLSGSGTIHLYQPKDPRP